MGLTSSWESHTKQGTLAPDTKLYAYRSPFTSYDHQGSMGLAHYGKYVVLLRGITVGSLGIGRVLG